ncbi:hypothetical protein HXX76_013004 [Chlamydomonas incerta]|uniref:Uncharacterized protein n=1 Tax=Chlamydomonas incerta TaxID=51695 RepID=A0A835SUV1_CHLIN|nr:hypothetical protein HXX76_013004 [Chlamydomonas incerta]|eukprot:KAG2426246.1 hypothetical protein HXX76_013004 [Chlamydomonas incerta]
MRGDKWTLDRGAGYYAAERARKKLSYLVQTGKHAGRTRVRYVGVGWRSFVVHVLRRDFFTTAVNAKLIQLVAVLVVWYFTMLLSWSTVYYIIWRCNSNCFIGFHGFRSAFMYATETQQTIGYGERATGECWVAALCVSVHSLQALLLDSVILGIVFSRISHPKQRGRTVLISDCACMARRDGQLKFMFRLADIQRRSVIDPRVRVEMYTWGGGRRTAEGEKIPVIAQELSVTMDRTLLLPVVVQHNVDEASPLFGHTLQSLEAVSAEIVVTFEASSELGDTFMARQSYLPSEIHWGHTFVNIITPPQPPETQAEVDLSRFHDVEPQPGLGDEMTMPHRLSRRVVAGGSAGAGAVVPGRLLCENTLVLSEDAVVTCRNGRPYLMFRLGDTFPGHVVDVTVTATLYRWHASHTVEGEFLPYEEQVLDLEPAHLLLRYPVTLMHELDPATSPVAHWATQKGLRQDADAEVVVVARGTLYSRQEVVTRSRVYSVLGDVKWGHAFLPVVLPGTSATPGGNVTSSKLGAAVDWSHFHSTSPINMPPAPTAPRASPKGTSPRLSSGDGYFAQPGAGGAAGGSASGAGPSGHNPAASSFASDAAFAAAVSTAGAHAAAHAAASVFAPGGLGTAAASSSSGLRGGGIPTSGVHGNSRLSGIRGSHPAPAPPVLRMPSDLSASTGNLAALVGAAGGGGLHVGTPFPHHASMALTLPQLHSQREQREQQRERAQPGEAAGGSHGHGATATAPGGGGSAHSTAVQQLQRGAGVGMAAAALHRSPSALLLQAGGAEPPAASTAFAAPGAMPFMRKTDDEALTGPASDDHLSGGSPNSTYSRGSGAAPQQPGIAAYPSGVTGRPGGGGGGGGGTGSMTGPREGDRKDNDKTWHQTRSLFAALEGIQDYLQQQEAERQAAEAVGLALAEGGPTPSGGSGSNNRPLPPGAFF